MLRHRIAWIAFVCLAACGGDDTQSRVSAPGRIETPKTAVLETGAAILQSKPPIDAINAYLDGFHFYNGRQQAQMEAHHYCAILNDDVIQCVIYDGNARNAKIMGVEYIVDETLFAALPPDEKAMWHSHVYEVKSGQLVAPGIPGPAEHALMQKLIRTYGKTWHTWHTDLDKRLPLGMPQLMMGFTADGQADAAMVEARNRRMGIDGAARRKARDDIAAPSIDPAADAWARGRVIQVEDASHDGTPTR